MTLTVLSSAAWGSVFIKENMAVSETTSNCGIEINSGKLNGHPIVLIEQNEDYVQNNIDFSLEDYDAKFVVSLGEAYSTKKCLGAGDMVISSGASFLDPAKPNRLIEMMADRKLVDLGIKAAERFNYDERLCKVVVGRTFLNPGTKRTGRKLTFLPTIDIYCIDADGYPLTQWAVESRIPFLLVRTMIPVIEKNWQQKVTQFRWDMAKRNFWIVKGVLEGIKKLKNREIVRKVDLI